MVVARVVSGIGMGFINSTVPVFQSEFSPKAGRGLYVCMQLSTLNFGILLAYWIDYAFSSHLSSYAWRVPVILQCIFLLPMIPILLVVPETPRWLASHDRGDESLRVLQRLHRTHMSGEAIRLLHADIMNTVALEKSIGAGKWKDLIKNDSIQSQRRFFIACAIQAFQQLGGINAIIVRDPTFSHSHFIPVMCTPAHMSLTFSIVLLGYSVPEERRFRPAHERSDGWLLADVVLRCLVYPLAFDRSHWSPSTATVYDFIDGRGHGSPDWSHLPGAIQHRQCSWCRHSSSGNAFHLSGRFYHRLSGHGLGLSNRDFAIATQTARVIS